MVGLLPGLRPLTFLQPEFRLPGLQAQCHTRAARCSVMSLLYFVAVVGRVLDNALTALAQEPVQLAELRTPLPAVGWCTTLKSLSGELEPPARQGIVSRRCSEAPGYTRHAIPALRPLPSLCKTICSAVYRIARTISVRCEDAINCDAEGQSVPRDRMGHRQATAGSYRRPSRTPQAAQAGHPQVVDGRLAVGTNSCVSASKRHGNRRDVGHPTPALQ